MQELFYEESANMAEGRSAKTKYYIFKVLSIISYVLFGVWLFLFIMLYPFTGSAGQIILGMVFALLPAIIFLISGILLGKFKDKFYVDYDYTIVSGTIRFSKVIKEIKRKHIVSFDASDIEKIGKYGSELFEKYSLMPDVKTVILTSNVSPAEKKEFYYMVVNKDGEKKMYVLECTELFIVNVLKFAKRTVVDEALTRRAQ